MECCKLPQWGLGQSPSQQTIWCILESKSAALVAALFVGFPKNKYNFLHKSKLDIVWRYFSQGSALWRVFLLGQSPPLTYGSRHLGFAKLHYNVCLWLCMCCSFRRDTDMMRSKLLCKNKCNHLQHYSVSMSNKNHGGKLQSNNQVTASQNWVTLNLVENLALSVHWRRWSPPFCWHRRR